MVQAQVLAGAATAVWYHYVAAAVINYAISAVIGKILAPDLPKSGRNAKGLQSVLKSNVSPRRVIYGEAVVGGSFIYIETHDDTGSVPNELLKYIIVLAGHPLEDVLGVFIGDKYVNIAEPENQLSGVTDDLDANYYVNSGTFGTTVAEEHVKIIKVLGWAFADNQYVTDGLATKVAEDRTRASAISARIIGDWNQATPESRDTGTGLYTDTAYKVTNCAYIYLEFKANPDVFSAYPTVRFHVKGKRVYDPALDTNLASYGADSSGTHLLADPDTYEWSENWSTGCLDYLLNTSYGLGAKTSGDLIEIDWEAMVEASLDSAELITNGLPTPNTEFTPRYTLNGAFEVNSKPISNMEALLASGAGSLIYAQGTYKLRAGVYRFPNSPDDIINEDIIRGPLSIRTHTPRSDLFNKVAGVYVDVGYDKTLPIDGLTNQPTFEPGDFNIVDPVDGSGFNPYELIDGEEIIREVDFPYCIYGYEAQRISKIQLERVRQGLSIQFNASLEVLKYSVGDTVYLEILSSNKYLNEDFFNKLGLDSSVQNRPDSPGTPYYKQFKIVEMGYNKDFTIFVSLIEESEEIYDWSVGDANTLDYKLGYELIIDDPLSEILVPSWVVDSPDLAITEVVSGSDILTQLRWTAPDRGSVINALDRANIRSYRVEYGIVDNPSLATASRVSAWITAGVIVVTDTSLDVQGILSLTNIYIDPTIEYDFRVRATVHTGRSSAWAYYSEDIGNDFAPTVPFGTSRYYIKETNGTTIHNSSADILIIEARVVTSAGDNLLSSGTIKLYRATSPYDEITTPTFTTPSDGYTGYFDAGDINGDIVVALSDGAPDVGTLLDTTSLTDITDGVAGSNSITAYLTNEAETITALNDGTGYTLPGNPVSLFKVFDGVTDVTDDSAVIYSVQGTNPKNGLTVIISDTVGTKGEISLSGTSPTWTTDSEFFTLRAEYSTFNIDKVYSISKALEGDVGTDGITVYLTDDAAGVTADQDGLNYTLPVGVVTTFKIFDGITDITDTTAVAYSIVGAQPQNNLEATVNDTIGSKGEVTLSEVTPGWDSDWENFTIRANYNTVDYDQVYAFWKVRKGVQGDTGDTGSTGANGHSVSLTAVDMVFTYDTGGANPAPATSLVTATPNNFDSPQYRFLIDAVEVSPGWTTTATYTYTPDTAYANMPETVSVEAREGAGALEATDSITMAAIQTPTDGAAGNDAYTVVLTNEAHTLPTTNVPVVDYTGSGTSIRVFRGTTELDSIASAGTPTTGEFDVTAVVTTGTITVGAITTAGLPVVVADHSVMTTDQAIITYTINMEDLVTVTKLQSLSKSLEGDDGATGDTGADGDVGWGHDLIFSSVSSPLVVESQVEWTGGTIWTAAGDTFPIDSPGSNTGEMAARTYIYFDGNSPVPTTLSTTTDAQTSIGLGKILICVAENTTTEAYFQVFGGYGGLKIAADEIAVNSIIANNVAASFYTGRTFQTRASSDGSTPFPTTPRISMSVDAGFTIQAPTDDALLFEANVTDGSIVTGGFAEIGDIAASAIQGWSPNTVQELRDRLGTTIPVNPSGGTFTSTELPKTISGVTTITGDDPDSGIITHVSGTTLTVNCRVYDPGESDIYETNQNFIVPSYDVTFQRQVQPPGSWVNVDTPYIATVTGTATNQFISFKSWDCDYSINNLATVTDDPASGDYLYRAQVSYNSGNQNTPKITAFNYSEALVGLAGLSASVDEVITGEWTFDGAVTTADYGTGGRVKDGSDTSRPIGFNVMPPTSFNSTLLLALAGNGTSYEHASGSAHTVQVPSDGAIPVGATYIIRNWYADTSTAAVGGVLTIDPQTDVYLWWGDGSAVTGGTGSRTVAGGGIITIYKETDTIWHMWGTGIT